jgi:predicted aspartyl protease
MGMFKVRVRVGNPAETARFFEEDFWVDTGALYSFVPEDRLKEIGLEPLHTRELMMADG